MAVTFSGTLRAEEGTLVEVPPDVTWHTLKSGRRTPGS